MSKISITPNPSGTGVFTISSPATSTDRTLTLPDEAGTIITTAGVPSSAMPAGSVLQVVQAVKTDLQSISSSAYVDVSGLSVSITPSSATSKILVSVTTTYASSHATETYAAFKCLRDSTAIGISTAGTGANRNASFGGSTNTPSGYNPYSMNAVSWEYLDSPATTSATIYKVQACGSSGYPIVIINRTGASGNTDYVTGVTSTITVKEIAG